MPARTPLIRLHSAPITAPRTVMPPYQIAEAMPIGSRVRRVPSPTSPAKGGTTARSPGRKRLMKMPTMPKRRYSRSMTASDRGASRRRPVGLAKSRRP